MITVTQEPGAISFSRNPMIYGLQSDNLYQSAGQKFIGLLNFTDYTNSNRGNYNFTLNYGGMPLVFSVGLNTDDATSGYNLPQVSGSDPDTWLTLAMARMQGNYYLNRDFTLDIYSNTGGRTFGIRFTAKNVGDQYQVTCDSAVQANTYGAQLATMAVLTAGLSKQPRSNFKIMVEVWMMLPDGSDYERLSQAFPDVDDNGSCVYDISGTVSDGLAAYGFDRPDLSAPSAEICVNTCRKYYLQVAEVFGDSQVIRAVTQTTTKTAIYGSFSKRMVEELLFPDFFINGALLNFLDQELPVKTTHLTQPEFLTFCAFNAGIITIKLRVNITYSDNTTVQIPDVYPFNEIPQYTKVCFPTGYSQLNLGLFDNTKTVVSWTVQVFNDQNVAISQVKTYVLDYTYRPYGRYLLYQNSFGGYISNFTYGRSSREYELTFNSAEITPKGGFKLIDGDIIDYDMLATDKITLVTGFMPRRALLVYRDFILSVDRFLVDKGKALPISILSNSIKEFKDGDNLYSQSFDIGFRWAEEVYTYDPDEVEPYTPADLANYTPTIPDPDMVDNFDNRYYLKTLTYNRTEVDGFISNEAAARAAADTALQNAVNALTAEVGQKMDSGETFDDRYYTKTEINNFLGAADPLDYGAGSANPIVIAGYQAAYPNFGDSPAIMVFETITNNDGSTSYRYRTDIQPVGNFVAGHLDNISISSPTKADGTTRAPLRIIIKAT